MLRQEEEEKQRRRREFQERRKSAVTGDIRGMPAAESPKPSAVKVHPVVAEEKKEESDDQETRDASEASTVAPWDSDKPIEKEDESSPVEEKMKKSRSGTKACFVLTENNPLRKALQTLTENSWFDRFILVLILISSIMLALDEPSVQPGSFMHQFLFISDIVMTSIFCLEMLFKMVAQGLIFHRGAYLRNSWNVLDFVVVVISVLSLAAAGVDSIKALRSLRALRALRPLRVIKRYPGMRLVVSAIFKALPQTLNVFMVLVFFWVVFGIIGVQQWKGALRMCSDPNVTTKEECVGTFDVVNHAMGCSALATAWDQESCRINGSAQFDRKWESLPVNFDHIGRGFLTAFEITSGEMWPDIMYTVVEAEAGGKTDVPLVRDKNPIVAIYFMALIFVCSFVMLNVFIGVVIDTFNKMKSEQNGSRTYDVKSAAVGGSHELCHAGEAACKGEAS